jgi:hypothetical protein
MSNGLRRKHLKGYYPNHAIVSLMTKMLQHKDDKRLGGFVNKKRKRYFDKEKVLVLDRHIFPSMANLIFFFKSISRYPELEEVFENDIKDLLGVRRGDPEQDDYGFIFSQLLRSILLIEEEIHSEQFEEVADRKDFRLQLNQILQEIVSFKVDISLKNVFKNEKERRIVMDDFNRVELWTRMLSDNIDKAAEDNIPPRRIIKIPSLPIREDDEPI